MHRDNAQGYIVTHDNRVKQLNRQPVSKLREIHAQALRVRGMSSLFGGPMSKDEFINAIADLEFPDIAQAREIHYHSMGV